MNFHSINFIRCINQIQKDSCPLCDEIHQASFNDSKELDKGEIIKEFSEKMTSADSKFDCVVQFFSKNVFL